SKKVDQNVNASVVDPSIVEVEPLQETATSSIKSPVRPEPVSQPIPEILKPYQTQLSKPQVDTNTNNPFLAKPTVTAQSLLFSNLAKTNTGSPTPAAVSNPFVQSPKPENPILG